LLGADIKIPTFSRRGGHLMILPKRIASGEPLHFLVDSIGVKFFGEGKLHDQEARILVMAPISETSPRGRRQDPRDRRRGTEPYDFSDVSEIPQDDLIF
jgi:hypothetical protein